MLYVFQEACGIWWETRKIPIVAAVLNLSINIIGVKLIGLYAVPLSTILAIFIIVNCKNSKDAIIKCFVFFLISQPLIYLVEIVIDTFINNGNLL